MELKLLENEIYKEIENLFSNDASGHDLFHSKRVYELAKHIAKGRKVNQEKLLLIALLHDADDCKICKTENNENARKIIRRRGFCVDFENDVIENINKISFKGTGESVPASLEGKIVQDADRLDALGAIGIARAFAYGGSKNRPIYVPGEKEMTFKNEDEYRKQNGSTISHFYQKLLKLKGLMNTEEGKLIAIQRTEFLNTFLNEFYDEWNFEAKKR